MSTCLVVDDSRVIRKVARRILEDLGFAVAEAADGVEAMAYCRTNMPDAVLVDWYMPIMNGVDFVRQLRAEPYGDQPTVLFCSAETTAASIAQAMDAGADEYIMKPFDSDILRAKLDEAAVVAQRRLSALKGAA